MQGQVDFQVTCPAGRVAVETNFEACICDPYSHQEGLIKNIVIKCFRYLDSHSANVHFRYLKQLYLKRRQLYKPYQVLLGGTP